MRGSMGEEKKAIGEARRVESEEKGNRGQTGERELGKAGSKGEWGRKVGIVHPLNPAAVLCCCAEMLCYQLL